MMQYSTYSVISPEGCAAILWKSADNAGEAAESLGITSQRLKTLGAHRQDRDRAAGRRASRPRRGARRTCKQGDPGQPAEPAGPAASRTSSSAARTAGELWQVQGTRRVRPLPRSVAARIAPGAAGLRRALRRPRFRRPARPPRRAARRGRARPSRAPRPPRPEPQRRRAGRAFCARFCAARARPARDRARRRWTAMRPPGSRRGARGALRGVRARSASP